MTKYKVYVPKYNENGKEVSGEWEPKKRTHKKGLTAGAFGGKRKVYEINRKFDRKMERLNREK